MRQGIRGRNNETRPVSRHNALEKLGTGTAEQEQHNKDVCESNNRERSGKRGRKVAAHDRGAVVARAISRRFHKAGSAEHALKAAAQAGAQSDAWLGVRSGNPKGPLMTEGVCL
jgi:hypothetical protein